MLDVMPELNHERHSPPLPRCSGKTFSESPDSDQHHDRVSIMQHFRAYKPRKAEAKNAIGLQPGPTENVKLVSLREMLRPVCQHDEGKNMQRALMPNAVQFVVETKVGRADPRGVCGD